MSWFEILALALLAGNREAVYSPKAGMARMARRKSKKRKRGRE